MGRERLGRTILHVYHHKDVIQDPVLQASVGAILRAGQAMDFAARLRDHGLNLTPAMAKQFACLAGINQVDLRLVILPALKAVNVVDYSVRDGELVAIQDYVGVTALILDQL